MPFFEPVTKTALIELSRRIFYNALTLNDAFLKVSRIKKLAGGVLSVPVVQILLETTIITRFITKDQFPVAMKSIFLEQSLIAKRMDFLVTFVMKNVFALAVPVSIF